MLEPRPIAIKFGEDDPRCIAELKGHTYFVTEIEEDEDDYKIWFTIGRHRKYSRFSAINEPGRKVTLIYATPTTMEVQSLINNIRSTLDVLCNESNDVQQDSGGMPQGQRNSETLSNSDGHDMFVRQSNVRPDTTG